jgi:pimeloyl-ACP methyl ester carboxylesterase
MVPSAHSALRILCLHSFRMSGNILRRQLSEFSNFEAVIHDLAELSFLDGPRVCDAEAEARMPSRLKAILPPPYYEWWNRREATDGSGDVYYDSMEETIALVRDHIAAHGPFDGILGFSQGGSLAHLMCMLQDSGDVALKYPVRFGIFMSARTSRHKTHVGLVESLSGGRRLSLPSMVIYGGRDSDVPPEMTRELLGTLDPETTTELFLPQGTHRVPNLSDGDGSVVRAFLQEQMRS